MIEIPAHLTQKARSIVEDLLKSDRGPGILQFIHQITYTFSSSLETTHISCHLIGKPQYQGVFETLEPHFPGKLPQKLSIHIDWRETVEAGPELSWGTVKRIVCSGDQGTSFVKLNTLPPESPFQVLPMRLHPTDGHLYAGGSAGLSKSCLTANARVGVVKQGNLLEELCSVLIATKTESHVANQL